MTLRADFKPSLVAELVLRTEGAMIGYSDEQAAAFRLLEANAVNGGVELLVEDREPHENGLRMLVDMLYADDITERYRIVEMKRYDKNKGLSDWRGNRYTITIEEIEQ